MSNPLTMSFLYLLLLSHPISLVWPYMVPVLQYLLVIDCRLTWTYVQTMYSLYFFTFLYFIFIFIFTYVFLYLYFSLANKMNIISLVYLYTVCWFRKHLQQQQKNFRKFCQQNIFRFDYCGPRFNLLVMCLNIFDFLK